MLRVDLLGSFSLFPLCFAAAGNLASLLGASTILVVAGIVEIILILLGLMRPSVRAVR